MEDAHSIRPSGRGSGDNLAGGRRGDRAAVARLFEQNGECDLLLPAVGSESDKPCVRRRVGDLRRTGLAGNPPRVRAKRPTGSRDHRIAERTAKKRRRPGVSRRSVCRLVRRSRPDTTSDG